MDFVVVEPWRQHTKNFTETTNSHHPLHSFVNCNALAKIKSFGVPTILSAGFLTQILHVG